MNENLHDDLHKNRLHEKNLTIKIDIDRFKEETETEVRQKIHQIDKPNLFKEAIDCLNLIVRHKESVPFDFVGECIPWLIQVLQIEPQNDPENIKGYVINYLRESLKIVPDLFDIYIQFNIDFILLQIFPYRGVYSVLNAFFEINNEVVDHLMEIDPLSIITKFPLTEGNSC